MSVLNSISFSKKVKDSLIILLVGTLFGVLYPLLSKEDDCIVPIINGLIIGLTGSSLIVFNEIVLNLKRLRLLKFKAIVIYKSIVYFMFFIFITPLVVSMNRAAELDMSLIRFINQGGLRHFIFEEDFHIIITYALIATVIFIFTYQMSRKMGQQVMWNFILGKYFHPRHEERIFMFIDLNNSTSIAENLGDIEYNKFIRQFFFDITDSIIHNYGKIYRYVGDEVVISWKMTSGLKNMRFLNTFFDAKSALESNHNLYLKTYGVIPTFKASISSGKVIVGEIGEYKSQISFIGKVMYETAVMEKSCRMYQTDILISDHLLKKIRLPEKYISKSEGVVEYLKNSFVAVSSIKLS